MVQLVEDVVWDARARSLVGWYLHAEEFAVSIFKVEE